MIQFSSIPFLMVAVSAFPYLLARHAYANNFIDKAQRNSVAALSFLVFTWGVISAALAYQGFYSSPEFFSLYPGLWFPFIPLLVVAIPLLLFPRLRSALNTAGKVVPLRWFAYFQVLRVAAIGTAIKTYQGEFPRSVELWVGVPDFVVRIVRNRSGMAYDKTPCHTQFLDYMACDWSGYYFDAWHGGHQHESARHFSGVG